MKGHISNNNGTYWGRVAEFPTVAALVEHLFREEGYPADEDEKQELMKSARQVYMCLDPQGAEDNDVDEWYSECESLDEGSFLCWRVGE